MSLYWLGRTALHLRMKLGGASFSSITPLKVIARHVEQANITTLDFKKNMTLTEQFEFMNRQIIARTDTILVLEERARQRPSRACARWKQCCLISRPLEDFFLEDGCIICRYYHQIHLLRVELEVKADLQGKTLLRSKLHFPFRLL